MKEEDPNEVLWVADIAKLMKCSERKVRRLIYSGQLPMRKFGGNYFITREAWNRFLNGDTAPSLIPRGTLKMSIT